ncbi:MAG: aminotransferase class I/II-fold pyridoxal phosphate-dependent enzyme [Thermodesulfovibrionales bacterium]
MYPYPVKQRTSLKAASFTESVIRQMTREALAHGAINLAQGFPDFPAPDFIKRAAVEAIEQDHNQYAITWGAPSLRSALARKMEDLYHLAVDPDREITVCCGSTEGMISSLLAVVDPGEEVIVFEPFYENYGPDAVLCGAVPRSVRLHPPDFALDEEELRAAFSSRTKAIIINTPNNPSGKVFSAEELAIIAKYCEEYNVIAITDEIYEHIVYDGFRHVPMATLEGMRDRTITVSGISKTFSVTGWRVGYVIAPPDITGAIRKVHDFLTVGTAAPLQEAAARAIAAGGEYYRELAAFYASRRDYLLDVLRSTGFSCHSPAGAYYIMADISPWRCGDDVAFAQYLTREIGVAVVPGSSFYSEKDSPGAKMVRFTFCKKRETLEAAAERLRKLSTP